MDTTINSDHNKIDVTVAQEFKLKPYKNFCEPHHLHNNFPLEYQTYLKYKQEGRWLVYSWSALILQPLFFIFHKMYFLALIYASLFGYVFGFNFIYGLALALIFPFFALKLYELHSNIIYIRSLKKFKAFQKKYSTYIDAQKDLDLAIEKIKSNNKLSDRKKAKKIANLKYHSRWNYASLNEYHYFFDKIKPLNIIWFTPITFFTLISISISSLIFFSLNNPVGIKIKDTINQEFAINNPNNTEQSIKEKEQIKLIMELEDFGERVYNTQETFFVNSMLLHYNKLTNTQFLDLLNNIIAESTFSKEGNVSSNTPQSLHNSK